MLGKLMKYELKATTKLFLSLYLILLVFTGLLKVININFLKDTSSLSFLVITSNFSYFLLLLATILLTTFLSVYRFYKNLVTDEGYLMFTLPTTPEILVFSKLLIAVFWTICSYIVSFVSICISYGNYIDFKEIFSSFMEIEQTISDSNVLFNSTALLFIILAIWAITTIFSGLITYYLCIAFGQVILAKHKILGAFLSFIILNIMSNFIEYIIMFISMAFDSIDFSIIILFYTVGILLLTVLEFFAISFIFRKKLNLA